MDTSIEEQLPRECFSDLYNNHDDNVVRKNCDKCGCNWGVAYEFGEPVAFAGDLCRCLPRAGVKEMCISKGVRSFGIDVVTNALEQLVKKYNVPVVSVGCGLAAIESLTMDKMRGYRNKWVLVDPKPLSYEFRRMPNRTFEHIDYATVGDLVKEHPEIIGKCTLFLNWCLPNESTYDYDAIKQLNPQCILSIFEVYRGSNGSAGGELFYKWFSRLPSKFDLDFPVLGSPPKKSDYCVAHTTQLLPHPKGEFTDIRIVYITNTSINNPPPIDLPDSVESKFCHHEPSLDGCLIM